MTFFEKNFEETVEIKSTDKNKGAEADGADGGEEEENEDGDTSFFAQNNAKKMSSMSPSMKRDRDNFKKKLL